MKLLSIVVPCYNSQAYMRHCIEALLPGGEKVEIIIVNDGSKDNTGEVADEYAAKYPTIVKAIHQVNGGHGDAVNTGISNAVGTYFKVVDSDDWVDEEAYAKILSTLEKLSMENETVDMLVSNYVYEKEGALHKKVIHYSKVLPEEQIFTWDKIGHFRKGQYILMHSVIYRLQLLRDCGLHLPKHTFYVDNLYVFVPLPYVNNLYYLNVDFYRYFIGRDDQSVNEKVMISRIDQQIRVNKLMMELVDIHKVSIPSRRKYMMNYFEIITVVSTILMIRSGTEENLQKKQELWQYIKEKDLKLYHRLRHGIMGVTVNLPGKVGHKISLAAYKLSQKAVGFN